MLYVLLYDKKTNKPAGIPDQWPAETIEASESPGIDWVTMTVPELEAHKATHQAAYDTWYASTLPPPDPDAAYLNVVKNARAFGDSLINSSAASNIRYGITQAGKTKLIGDAVKEAVYYLQSGSLYEAMTAIDAIAVTPEMSPFITAETLLMFKNKIRAYLGLAPL